jgi:cytohesin
MKHLLLTTIAAVVLVGCGPSVDIHEAAREGSIEAVQQHIATGTDVSTKDGSGRTPLHNAALKGRKEIAKLLIAGGADVNAKDNLTSTPLHFAALEGRREVIELLIAEGADVNAKKKRGGSPTPLDLAIQQKKTETADLLRKHGGKTSDWFKARESIHIAAETGHIEAVKKHLAAGTDVNAKDGGFGDATTPLHLAALYGHMEIAELLIAKGADVNAQLDDGSGKRVTPLDMAIQRKKTETVDLLRKHGGKTGEELKAEGK